MLIEDMYHARISRNIGHITYREQERIRTSKVAIMGVGGLGGPLTDQLVRIGCQNIIICDHDKYDHSNLNRQLCTLNDLGKYKVDHLKDYILQIDPELNISEKKEVNSKNIDDLLKDVQVVVLSLDDPVASIIIARKCREKCIPMVESWGIPYLWAWWFTPESIDYESFYNMPTRSTSIEELERTTMNASAELFPKLTQFPGLKKIYDREKGMFEKLLSGQISFPSMAPFVHLTASYLATEIIFAGLLSVKEKVLAPKVVGYDYIRMRPINF
ncbi:MAG: ThiF family adenylyltransferase, partial [Promethearchaeota archaeon]